MTNMLMCGAALALPLAWWWKRLNEWMDDIDSWTQERDQ